MIYSTAPLPNFPDDYKVWDHELTTERKGDFQKGYSDPWNMCNRRQVVPVWYTCAPNLENASDTWEGKDTN